MKSKLNQSRLGQLFEIWRVFTFLGCTSFGGPVAHLAYFRKEFVERRAWLNDEQYSQLLAICQFLPGPASSQVGFGVGLTRGGVGGAVAAFVGFTLPSAILILLFVALLPWFSGPTGQAILHGLKLVAVIVVADALWSMSKKLCQDGLHKFIALCALLIVLLLPWLGAQILALLAGAALSWVFSQPAILIKAEWQIKGVSRKAGALVFCSFLGLLLLAYWPISNVLSVQTAQIFYRTGALVFGGGHVVLPWLQSMLVPQWLNLDAFLAGYGAAQALPGPLFTFAGYLGALMNGEELSASNASIALLFVFLPGFLLLTAILPFWQQASKSVQLAKLMTGLSAAVVGILAAAWLNPIAISGLGSIFDVAVVALGLVILTLLKRSVLCLFGLCVASQLLFLILI